MRILILDDNEAVAQILGVSLRSEGYSVLVFTSPQEALKHIHEADVLVTDYHLAEMTGLEVARRAHEQGWRGSLFLGSGHDSAISEQIEHPLLRHILDKPFSPHELPEIIHKSDKEKLPQDMSR
jgi:two-component system response regulator MtrA